MGRSEPSRTYLPVWVNPLAHFTASPAAGEVLCSSPFPRGTAHTTCICKLLLFIPLFPLSRMVRTRVPSKSFLFSEWFCFLIIVLFLPQPPDRSLPSCLLGPFEAPWFLPHSLLPQKFLARLQLQNMNCQL